MVAFSGCTQNQQNTTGQNAPNAVTILNFEFNPDTLTVPFETTVTRIN